MSSLAFANAKSVVPPLRYHYRGLTAGRRISARRSQRDQREPIQQPDGLHSYYPGQSTVIFFGRELAEDSGNLSTGAPGTYSAPARRR